MGRPMIPSPMNPTTCAMVTSWGPDGRSDSGPDSGISQPRAGSQGIRASAQADGLLPRATPYPLGVELADFPRLARLSSHAEANGPLGRIVVGDPRVRAVPRDGEALQHRHDTHRQD